MTKDARDDKDSAKPGSRQGDKGIQGDKGAKPVVGSPAEDVKRKFREALDKKHAHGGRDVAEDGDHAKINEAHGPAKAQQMFRRKSG